jgi:hypothetical protein
MAYKNTNIISRLEEILSDKYGEIGIDQPVQIELWNKEGLWAQFLSWFGKAPKETLTVHWSPNSGYTLHGPDWRTIKRKLGCSALDFGKRIVSELTDVWELTTGWERALEADLSDLDSL